MAQSQSGVLGRLSVYELSHLVEHLVRAGRGPDVHRLLRLPGLDGPAWYEAKTGTDDERGYERDLEVARRLADDDLRRAASQEERAAAVGLQAQYALVHASLRAAAAELTPDLLATLVTTEQWTVPRGIAAAARVGDPVVRAGLLAVLASGAGVEDRRRVLAEALDLDEGSRAPTLVTIAAQLPAEALPDIPAAAHAMGDDRARVEAIVAVAARLPDEHVADCLGEALSLSDQQARVQALVSLAGRLSPELADKVVFSDGLLHDERFALDVVASLAPSLTEDGAGHALAALRRLRVGARRAEVVAAILHALPARLRADARRAERAAVTAIRSQGERATALALLGCHAEALDVALGIPTARRAAVLAALAPHLTPAVARRALDAATQLPSAGARSEVLIGLAPVLDPAAMLAALKLVQDVPAPKARAEMLAALAPRLPGPRVGRAVQLALEIRDVGARAVALAALEPRMEERHRATARYRRRGHLSLGLPPAAEVDPAHPSIAEPVGPFRQSPEVEAESPAALALAALAAAREGGPPAGFHEADGDQTRERLVRLAVQDVAHRGALRNWVKTVLPDHDAAAARALAELPSEAPGTPEPAGDGEGEGEGEEDPDLLRAAIVEAMDEWAVDLRDPVLVRGLRTLDGVSRRTALHLALALAERNERDDELAQEEPELADLAPVFAQFGRIGELLEAARDLVGPYRRAEGLVAVLPYVPQGQRADVAAEAAACLTEAVRKASPRIWWRRFGVVVRMAPLLDGRRLQRLATALTRAERATRGRLPSLDARRLIVNEARLALVPHATGRLRSTLCQEVLASAAELRVDSLRRATLEVLAPWLTPPVIEQAGDVAASFRNRADAASTLGAVARRSAELGLDAEAAGLVRDIGRLPGALGDRAVLAVVARHVDLLPPADLQTLWCPSTGHGVLWDQTGSRAELFDALAVLAPVVARLGGPGALDAVQDAIRVVRQWWP